VLEIFKFTGNFIDKSDNINNNKIISI